ncbi:premelanosome protein a isoform X4 [Scyliorhinus canicula]|uniref:premelanosome protein a isoform X4 n=1 Tax=Scyliorhinus canicula TaxID=7830 RepID=UPI0018F5EE98|nr:premelanosome protein a isoform X4 [Scyliorhinus canicula]
MCSDLQLLLIFTIGAAPMIAGWSPNDGHRRNKENSSPRRLTGYKSWNSDLYPIWKAGDSRWHDCWKGGPISLDVNNDAPTLTGAEATFYINLKFPQNQTIQSDGEIVWAENCTLNGTQVTAGESVYPNDTWQNGDELFPDGRSIPRIAKKKGSKFIFVWQTLGKYQQVVDGPSSLVIVDTADAPLGSYTMEVTVYHYRGRQKFIPIGKANSQFTITDQIPFSVEISQISDLNDADNSFIQNRAILFGIKLHDPSLYLKDADISFSWDFGDGSGTLISRVHTVTHTYLSTGAFNPHVILQAAIPSTMCSTANPTIEDSSPMISTITTDPLPSRGSSVVTLDLTVSSVNSEPTAREVTTGNTSPSQPPTVEPVAVSTPVSDSPVPSSAQQPIIIPTSTGDPIPIPSSTISPVIPASDGAINAAIAISEQATNAATPASDDAINAAIAISEQAITAAIPASDEAITAAIGVTEQAITAAIPASDDAINAAIAISEQAITAAIPASDEATNAAIPASDEAITAAIPASDEATNAAIVVTEQSTTVSATMVISESETTALSTNEGLMLVKRQALEDPEDNCLIYRYGTFSATINIVQGIESVEIVQISNVVPGSVAEMQQNAVDFTVTCQGSFPSEICTVVLDADCINPQQTDCSEVLPADECQLILRQFFNSSGTYCVNVSMTNAVSLAVASARVDVNPTAGGTPNTTEALVLVGMLLIASIIGVVAVTYRKYKEYAPLQQDASRSHSEWIPDRAAVNIFLRNMFGCQRSKVSENSPLLHGCVV